MAQKKLIAMIPEELQADFAPLIDEDTHSPEDAAIVKQADALCAYLKCLEEIGAGNTEFHLAKARLEKTLEERRSQNGLFPRCVIPGFSLSLDEISQ